MMEASVWIKSKDRNRVMFQLEDKIARVRLTQHFCFIRPSKDWIGPIHIGEGILFYNLPIEMLVSSRNILTDTPKTIFNQISSCYVGPLNWHIKLTHLRELNEITSTAHPYLVDIQGLVNPSGLTFPWYFMDLYFFFNFFFFTILFIFLLLHWFREDMNLQKKGSHKAVEDSSRPTDGMGNRNCTLNQCHKSKLYSR